MRQALCSRPLHRIQIRRHLLRERLAYFYLCCRTLLLFEAPEQPGVDTNTKLCKYCQAGKSKQRLRSTLLKIGGYSAATEVLNRRTVVVPGNGL